MALIDSQNGAAEQAAVVVSQMVLGEGVVHILVQAPVLVVVFASPQLHIMDQREAHLVSVQVALVEQLEQ